MNCVTFFATGVNFFVESLRFFNMPSTLFNHSGEQRLNGVSLNPAQKHILIDNSMACCF